MEPNVSFNVIFFNTTKKIWEIIHEMYSMEKNMFKVYDLYNGIFQLEQGDKSVTKYYSVF